MLLLTGNGVEQRDFISYWSAGHQVAAHQNPYDSEAIQRIERSYGLGDESREIIMRNPPSALALVLPLSLVSVRAGWLIWAGLLLFCLIASVRMLWIMHGRQTNHLELLGYSFGPALACLLAGQTALFSLLGLVLFLRWHSTRPFLAGVSLWLCALKSHLFLPFGAAMLVWVVMTKRYTILAGAAAVLTASCAIAYLIDPLAWSHYRYMMSTWGIERETIPCLSVMLRLALKPAATWIQYVPVILGSLWGLSYFWKHRQEWDWMKHGNLLMLVSVATAPYAWVTDEAVLIPAILGGAYFTRSPILITFLALGSAIIQIETVHSPNLHSFFYIWTASGWLVWYLCATRSVHPIEVADFADSY